MGEHIHGGQSHKVTTLDLIKRYIDARTQKMLRQKQPIQDFNKSMADEIIDINHIAIVLDGRVEDVIRAQNRLAALLLSNPTFVEFNPETSKIQLNDKYVNGKFISPGEQGYDD